MEAALFVLDIVCMVLLLLALARAERGGKAGLGLFAYKDQRKVSAKPSDKGPGDA